MNEYAPSNKLVITSAIILLVGFILAAIGISINLPGLAILGSGIIGASVVLIYRLFKAKKNKEFAKELVFSQKDERLMKIYVHAGNMSFWAALLLVLGYIIFTGTRVDALLLFPAVLMLIYLLSAFYYMKKF